MHRDAPAALTQSVGQEPAQLSQFRRVGRSRPRHVGLHPWQRRRAGEEQWRLLARGGRRERGLEQRVGIERGAARHANPPIHHDSQVVTGLLRGVRGNHLAIAQPDRERLVGLGDRIGHLHPRARGVEQSA